MYKLNQIQNKIYNRNNITYNFFARTIRKLIKSTKKYIASKAQKLYELKQSLAN